jgi:hypothetical protein
MQRSDNIGCGGLAGYYLALDGTVGVYKPHRRNMLCGADNVFEIRRTFKSLPPENGRFYCENCLAKLGLVW